MKAQKIELLPLPDADWYAGWPIEDCLSTQKFPNGNARKAAMEKQK